MVRVAGGEGESRVMADQLNFFFPVQQIPSQVSSYLSSIIFLRSLYSRVIVVLSLSLKFSSTFRLSAGEK